MTEPKPELKAEPKAKYDPNGRYVALKPIKHPSGAFKSGDGKTFSMKHRSPSEVEYLVEVVKAIAPA
jgi:hypothetical protein